MKNIKELELVREVINLLQNGVLEDDNVRPFNMIDYYQMTRRTPKSLYESVVNDFNNKFSEEDKKTFYSFVGKSLSDKRLRIDDIMEVKHMVLLDGVPTEINENDKLNVINYLKENKIPITSETYNITLKKYLDGSIDFEKKEENKLLVR